jgi:transcription antitermination factor NusG
MSTYMDTRPQAPSPQEHPGQPLHAWNAAEAVHPAWYAVYTRARHERIVRESLEGRGIAAFSPSYKIKRRRKDRTVELDQLLFPGYVFCQLDPQDRLPVLQIPGVVFIVSRSGEPDPIDPNEINSLLAAIQSGRPVLPWDYIPNGQRVRIRAGALAGSEGVLSRIKSESRLVVSVTLLQRSVAVEIDQDTVEAIY